MAKISIQTTKKAIPRCYCYSTPTISGHNGWVKIGYTEQDDVEVRIRQQLQTAHIPHITEWSDIAVFADGKTYFRDSDFHAYMQKQGIERMKPMDGDTKAPEWFRINGDDSFNLYSKFRRNKGILDTIGTVGYNLRAEQDEAVSLTYDYFMSHKNGEFLWNAKPRFGKTLATYDLCKRLKADKDKRACNILIVTNRPAIANSWYDIETLQELVRKLRKAGAISHAGVGAGVHIHIGANGHTPQSLRNLANLMASHETLIADALKID